MSRGLSRSAALIATMVLATALVAGLAAWDLARGSERALTEFGGEQAKLASGLAMALGERASLGQVAPPELQRLTSRFEVPGQVAVLLRAPGGAWLPAREGNPIALEPLEQALRTQDSTVRLSRPEAASLGLPARTAMAGLARAPTSGGEWTVAVVASAERQRDREQRERWRVTFAVVLAASLVLVFGGVALREQRKELQLSATLALAELARDRDDRLARMGSAAALVALASGVAHEVSTPLGVIAGRAEQLRDRVAGDERNSRAVQSILEQAERIDQVVRSFLRLVRGGAPALSSARAEQVVEGAVGLVEHRFREASVSLAADVPKDLPELACDLTLLQQALVNLLLNACDASPRGGVVRVRAGLEGGGVAFTVLDQGVGITDADAARALQPFFTTKPRDKGTGMGLAIASEIAKSHRGAVSIAPASGGGTCARLTVPLGGAVPEKSGGADARA